MLGINIKRWLTALVLSLAATAAFGQANALKVGTGECAKDGACSTYVTMFRELKAHCSSVPLNITEVTSKGSVETIDRIASNEINAGIVQTDVLFWRKRTEDLSAIKTLVTLHPEEIHFVARTESKLSKGGYGVGPVKIGKEEVVFNEVGDLNGYRVGVVENSGSMITARLIRAETDLKYEVVTYANTDALMAALDGRLVEAAVLVGGSPLPAIAKLDSSYKLLKFSEGRVKALAAVYRPATLNYSKMGAQGVASMATEANFVVRDYKGATMVAGLSAMRTCAQGAVDDLKETIGTHKKWQAVTADNKGKWTWYELPAPAAPAPKAKK